MGDSLAVRIVQGQKSLLKLIGTHNLDHVTIMPLNDYLGK